jgi:hypothetical protein
MATSQRIQTKPPVRASSKATADVPATKSFSYSALPAVDGDTDAEVPRSRRMPIAMLILGVALVAGAAIVVFAIRGGNSEAKRPDPPPGSAAIVAVADASAPVAIIDAAVAVAEVDAAPAVHAPKTTAELVADLAKASDAQDYAAVLAGCANSAVLPRAYLPCTVAACKLHESGKAQRWFAKLSGRQRESAVSSCEGTGVALVHHEAVQQHHDPTTIHHDPTPPDAGVAPSHADAGAGGPCKPDPNDPLACQH